MERDTAISAAPAESSRVAHARGGLHVGNDDGGSPPVPPHTASEAADEDGEHVRQRVLAVKLDLRKDDNTFRHLQDLSWQAARYRNLFLRARWAEAKSLCVDPKKDIPHSVTKWIRHDEKMELSGAAYSAAEREVAAVWQRHAKRILAGAPLPEWKPTAALSIRGHKNRSESGVRITEESDGRFVAELQVQAATCEGGSWLRVPLAAGTVKDYQAEMLRRMVSGEVSIRKASILIRPVRHQVILRLCYALPIEFPKFGERKATLGPIGKGNRLWLRTEFESRDFSGRLNTLLRRKDDWDLIRRRALAQIGRRKGGARAKRKLLARMSWKDWLDTWLHTWSREIIDWLRSQGIGDLTMIGLEGADWPAYNFTQKLAYKGEDAGIRVHAEADLAQPATARAVKSEIRRERRKATKAANAIRELESKFGD